MDLVYPIYLDTPMMTGFLASLEGGLIEEASFEGKTTDSKEKSRSGSFGAKVSGLLSSFLDVEGKGQLAQRVSESSEEQYKSTVRFPTASLFIRLRDILIDQKVIKFVHSDEQIEDVSIGDLVEFDGKARPNPSHQIRRMFQQILPIMEPYAKMTENQLEQRLLLLKDAKPGSKYKIGNEEITFEDARQIGALRDQIKANKQETKDQSTMFQAIGELMSKLFPEDEADSLVLDASRFRAICRVYPKLARDERIQDIYDARWHCVGKVIGKLCESEQYDLLKSSPLSYFAKSQFSELAKAFNNEQFRAEVTDPLVRGPALILATLAIFV